MLLTIKNTLREGILIYDNNMELIFRSKQNGYHNFINADQYEPDQFSSETARGMCITAKKIASATSFNSLSEFLDNLSIHTRINTQTIEVQVDVPGLYL